MKTFRIAALLMGFLAVTSVTAVCQAQGNAVWGTIKGQVIYTTPYTPAPIPPALIPGGAVIPLVQENKIIDAKTKGLKNVVVWLRPDTEDRNEFFPTDKINPKLVKALPKHHVIDQPLGQFEPRSVAARSGDTWEVKNSSQIAHNPVTTGVPTFNVIVPPGLSHIVEAALIAQRTPIVLKCNVCPWTRANIRVFDHPYFAVTDANGKFEIKDVPMGNWRIVYWHEDGFNKGREGILGEKIVVNGPTLELKPIDFEFPQ